MNVKYVTLIVDACFSGSIRGDGMLMSAKGVAIKVDFGSLGEYIRKEVMRKSAVVNNKPQTPIVSFSPKISDSWKSMKFKN